MQQLSPIPDRLPPLCRSHSVSARFLEGLPQRGVIKLQATPLIQTVQHHRTPLAPRLGPTALFTLTPLGGLCGLLAQLVHIHDPKLTLTAAATAPTHRQQQRSTPNKRPLATFRIASHRDRLQIQLLELAVAFSTSLFEGLCRRRCTRRPHLQRKSVATRLHVSL